MGRWVRFPPPPPSPAIAGFGGQSPPEDRDGGICQNKKTMWYVYILTCKDKKTYIGCTEDLKDRFERHKKGRIKTTKDKIPVRLHCYFAFVDKYITFNFEKYLKSGSGRAFMRKHLI